MVFFVDFSKDQNRKYTQLLLEYSSIQRTAIESIDLDYPNATELSSFVDILPLKEEEKKQLVINLELRCKNIKIFSTGVFLISLLKKPESLTILLFRILVLRFLPLRKTPYQLY